MWVYLFRHGPAGQRDAERWPDDGQRALTARGERKTARAARGLARLERRPAQIFTSPLVRSARTAALLQEALNVARPPQIAEELAPGGSAQKLIARLQRWNGEVAVVVGHEPDLGHLAGLLLFGDPEGALPLKKAGCCAIDFEDAVHAGAGRLVWLLSPRLLRRAAGKAVRA